LRSKNLEETDSGDEVKALIKLMCDNLEIANKYWLEGQ